MKKLSETLAEDYAGVIRSFLFGDRSDIGINISHRLNVLPTTHYFFDELYPDDLQPEPVQIDFPRLYFNLSDILSRGEEDPIHDYERNRQRLYGTYVVQLISQQTAANIGIAVRKPHPGFVFSLKPEAYADARLRLAYNILLDVLRHNFPEAKVRYE